MVDKGYELCGHGSHHSDNRGGNQGRQQNVLDEILTVFPPQQILQSAAEFPSFMPHLVPPYCNRGV